MPGIFNKTHYEAVARLLRESPTLMSEERRALTDEFATLFAADNERFIYGRFIAAATPDISGPFMDDLPLSAEEPSAPFKLMFEVLAAVTDVSPSAKHTINEILYDREDK